MPTDRHYDPIAQALGHLLINFNSVEIHLSILIAHLMGHDVLTAAAFNASQSFSQKINFLKSITNRRIEDHALKAELLTTIRLANELNAKRNRFIHAHYARPMRVSKKRPLKQFFMQRLRDNDAGSDIEANTLKLEMRIVTVEEVEHLGSCAADLADLLKQIKSDVHLE